jgi:hypothetical protein
MNVVSVVCKNDQRLHLAAYQPGLGTEVHTLCLERWKDYQQAREGCQFCPECAAKWAESLDASKSGA